MRTHRSSTAAVLLAAAVTAVMTAGPAAAAPAAPTEIAARSFSLTTDMTSLAGNVSALDEALAAKRRTVGQVMESGNRERGGLCHPAVHQKAKDRSGTGVTGFCWNDSDDSAAHWYPQGITTSRDAYENGQVDGHQIVLASWYHKPEKEPAGTPNKGVRISFTDWDADWANTYRHVLLVEPTAGGDFKPVPIHAGGIMWYGNLLYVVDTHNGLRIFDTNRIYSVSTGDSMKVGKQSDGTYHAFDYAFVLTQVGWARNAGADLRYSFVSLDRATSPDSMVVGEYSADSGSSSRVVRFPLDYADRLPRSEDDGRTYGSEAYETGIPQVQGVIARDGKFWFASSNGSKPGYLRAWSRGTATVHTYAWVVGAEDLSYWADPDKADMIWTLTERENEREVLAVPQADWD